MAPALLELLFPEVELAGELFALQPAALPLRVIGVLDVERRQRIGLAAREGGVERSHFADEEVERPAVADDVMLRDEEEVLVVGDAQQRAANERAGGEVEWRDRFAMRDS